MLEKISLIVTSIVVVFSFCTFNGNEAEEIRQTTATPASGKVVVLDAGHGKPDRPELLEQVVFWNLI